MSTGRLFSLGQIVATPGALKALESHGVQASDLLRRHQSGDWGGLPPEDVKANQEALKHGARLLSSYPLGGGAKLWIITEADRAVTTLLLPSEY